MTDIYWHGSKPDDFINVKLGDWVQGVGFIETNFELNFIHAFGKFYKSKAGNNENTQEESKI